MTLFDARTLPIDIDFHETLLSAKLTEPIKFLFNPIITAGKSAVRMNVAPDRSNRSAAMPTLVSAEVPDGGSLLIHCTDLVDCKMLGLPLAKLLPAHRSLLSKARSHKPPHQSLLLVTPRIIVQEQEAVLRDEPLKNDRDQQQRGRRDEDAADEGTPQGSLFPQSRTDKLTFGLDAKTGTLQFGTPSKTKNPPEEIQW